jgi:hypothetical protein
MTQATESSPPASRLRPARMRTADLMLGLLLAGSLAVVGAATATTRLDGAPGTVRAEDAVQAVGALRRTFGYDGVVHELERLRRGDDPAALADLDASLQEARAAIGRLRVELSDAGPQARRALDQLDAAGRRLETLLRADGADPIDRLAGLPVLEPLFVLDEAVQALDRAMAAEDRRQVERMFWLTVTAACLLAAAAMLLAFWVRLSLLAPLRRLTADIAGGTRTGINDLAERRDEFGILAAALKSRPAIAGKDDLPATLQEQAGLLERIHGLVESLAHRPVRPNEPANPEPAERTREPDGANEPGTGNLHERTRAAAPAMPPPGGFGEISILPTRSDAAAPAPNEPEPAGTVLLLSPAAPAEDRSRPAVSAVDPLSLPAATERGAPDRPGAAVLAPNEPGKAFSPNEPEQAIPIFALRPNEPEPSRPDMLHSIVEMVAKEQLRRHGGPQAMAPASADDPMMAALVDRVLARLDQVTQRVKLEEKEARRAS